MRARVAIVTSSVSCLPREKVEEYGIKVVPATLLIDGCQYRDGLDMAPVKAYELLAANKPFLTSAPSPGAYLEAFRELAPVAESILCLTIPTKLSMMYDSAYAAAAQMSAGYPVHVVDTGTAAGGQALIDLAAARTAAEGKSLAEIVAEVERLKRTVYMFGLMGTMRYLPRSGRFSRVLARVGSLLNIKPMVTIEEGEIRPMGVVRTKAAGVARMLKMMREKVGGRPVHAVVMHAHALEEGESLRRRVAAQFHCAELYLTDFSPLMGFATGPGTLVLAFYAEQPPDNTIAID